LEEASVLAELDDPSATLQEDTSAGSVFLPLLDSVDFSELEDCSIFTELDKPSLSNELEDSSTFTELDKTSSTLDEDSSATCTGDLSLASSPQATSNPATTPIIKNFFKAISTSPAKYTF
jgi:hypothetical protein